ncbi:MAG TPA: MarR family transcriptional regulator [Opitutae bacterium]|nr:MarR family transcriptional regulator [Opitutae bacterium]|tara:strand:- start:1861 stop:2316 length:456 start_codon:yes stop_codon:yes gene_type:complete
MPAKSSFGFKRPEDSPGFLLWQTTITWQRRIKETLELYGLTHPQFVILAITLWLAEHGNVPTQVRIVEMSKLDKMTVSKSLQKLATASYVDRSECKEDSRAKSIRLTAKGRALIRKLIPIVESIDAHYFSPLSQEERKRLLKGLVKVVQYS